MPSQNPVSRLFRGSLALVLCMALVGNHSFAAEGEPLAIRIWPNGVASIETQWNLRVAFGSDDAAFPNSQSLLIKTKKDGGFLLEQDGKPVVSVSKVDHTLDRLPNKAPIELSEGNANASPNAVRVRSAGRNLVLSVDGVRIAICENKDFASKIAATIKQLDLSYIVCPSLSEADVSSLVSKSAPAIWVIQGESGHNTIAASSHISASREEGSVVKLTTKPWEMSGELKELFEKKEISCKGSREIFAQLSVAQLNFKPKNGTHTPRWNCEHMMGRELRFFSEIYASQSPAIKPMDLNPKQMPADYIAKHPDWDGKEEARQMKRVEDFTRRFAYLLADLDLDKKAPRSFWTPRKLLMQMDRHYGEHTANTMKKFELQDWPKE